MANHNETVKKILKQSQSLMARNFNMGEHLRNTTQAAAAVTIIDSDEEDIAKLDEMLLKLKSMGVKIKSVANNQAKVINIVKKNSKNVSDLKHNTAKKFN